MAQLAITDSNWNLSLNNNENNVILMTAGTYVDKNIKISLTGSSEAGIDTSDADATADDIVSPKTAYVNGEKVEGTLVAKAINTTVGSASVTVDSENKLNFSLWNTSSYGKRYLIDKGQGITLKHSLENLGDATAEDVAAGKTFTSVAGLKVTGTIKEGNPNHKTGTPSYSSGIAKLITIKSTATEDAIIRKDSIFSATANASDFGNATVDDVAKGKTFTSYDGLKLTGTMESGGTVASDDNCEAYQITSASTALNFKRTDGDIKVWGYGYKSSGTYQKTVYAFCGDGYYTGSSWGTPSKTSATFRLNSDGTLSGLPGGLTALDVLVTKGI